MRTEGEDSSVDAGLGFAVKERPIFERLKHESLVDAVDHLASLLADGIEAEVHQHDKAVESNKQASILVRPTPVARRGLEGEKLGSPTFASYARALGSNRIGALMGEVPHDLPANGRIRIEKPFEVGGSGCVILQAHWSVIAKSVGLLTRRTERSHWRCASHDPMRGGALEVLGNRAALPRVNLPVMRIHRR